MGSIPVYTPQGRQGATTYPMVSVKTAMGPGMAVAGLGEELTKQGFELYKLQKDAERADELNRHTTDMARELQDLSNELETQETDHTAIIPSYEERASELRKAHSESIKDALVRRAFLENYGRTYLSRRSHLQRVANTRRIEFQTGNLLNSLSEYERLVGEADPNEFNDHIDRATGTIQDYINKGIINEATGFRLMENFRKNVGKTQIRSAYRANPKQVYQDLVEGKYAHLDPDDRHTLTKEARAEWVYQLDMEQKNQTLAEKLIKRQQDDYNLDLWVKISNKEVTVEDLREAAKLRLIRDEQFKSLFSHITNEIEDSIEAVIYHHLDNIYSGSGDVDDILHDARLGLLNPEDTTMLLTRQSKWETDQRTKQNLYKKEARDYLEALIITTGPGAPIRRNEEEVALNRAIVDLEKAVEDENLQGWEIYTKAIEIGDQYPHAMMGPKTFKKIRGKEPKNLDDIETMRDELMRGLYQKKIEEDEAIKAIEELALYEKYFQYVEKKKAMPVPKPRKR